MITGVPGAHMVEDPKLTIMRILAMMTKSPKGSNKTMLCVFYSIFDAPKL
jgi:hypothetical protein